MESPYQFESGSGYSIIKFEPELNDVQWAEIDKIGSDILSRINGQPQPACLIDLTALNYMGSSMVALVVRLWKTVKEKKGRMAVVNQHEMVLEVLQLAGLDKVWTIVPTREEGLKQLGKRGDTNPTGQTSDNSTPLLIGAFLCILIAAAGVYLMSHPEIAPTKIALAIAFGGSALSLMLGGMASSKATGTPKFVGIGIIALGFLILIAGVMNMPGIGEPTPAAPQEDVVEEERDAQATPAKNEKPSASAEPAKVKSQNE